MKKLAAFVARLGLAACGSDPWLTPEPEVSFGLTAAGEPWCSSGSSMTHSTDATGRETITCTWRCGACPTRFGIGPHCSATEVFQHVDGPAGTPGTWLIFYPGFSPCRGRAP
jgi:hypothetical protein